MIIYVVSTRMVEGKFANL